jgi:hypothetical protein
LAGLKEAAMLDLAYLGLTLALFVATLGLIIVFERLMEEKS